VDIDPKTLNIDTDKVAAAVTPSTKAIVAVEAFGHPGGMVELEQIAQQHELVLIEDACEGFGGHVTTPKGDRAIGSFGRAGVFGFYPNKQITTGEGGMIVTDDDAFAAVCRSLRNQGRDGMQWLAHQRLGYNYRLPEINAAMGVVQCQRLEEILDARRRVARLYMERLMTNRFLILPTIADDTHVSWFVFVVRLNDLFEAGDRDVVMQELRKNRIGCNNYFPPIHLQPYMVERFGFKPADFPVCEYVANRTLALPFFGSMTEKQVNRVCDTLERILERTLVQQKKRF
jgi:perosamine synthetase